MYIFNHRDFDGGILGLAWTGDPDSDGGVCEQSAVSGLRRRRLVKSSIYFNYEETVRSLIEVRLDVVDIKCIHGDRFRPHRDTATSR